MGVKTIETRARITAEDKTGGTFSAVAQKLRGLERQASATSRNLDHVARGMSSVSANASRHARVVQGINPPVGGGLMGPAGRAITSTATTAAVTATAAAPVVKSIVEASARRIDEHLSQRVAGLSAADQSAIAASGRDITARHRSISETEGEAMVRDLVTVVGGVEAAIRVVDEVAKLRIILKRATPGANDEEMSRQMGDIVRAADQVGATASKEKFAQFANDYARISNAFGGAISPSMYREFIQGTRGAASGYDRAFLTGVAPSLIQSLGPEAGVALQSLHSAVVGGTMEKDAKKELASLGLVDKKGRIVGRELAQRDPYLWTQQRLKPALEHKGITGEAAQGEVVDRVFSDRTARQAVKMLLFNESQIERDRAASGRAQDLSAADAIEKTNLATATKALASQFDNLSAALGNNVTPRLVGLGNWIADRLGDHAKDVAEDPKTATRTWIAGGIGAGLAGHLGLSTIGGYFGGAGLATGVTSLAATTPALLGASALGAGYRVYKGLEETSRAGDEVDRVFAEAAAAARNKAGAKLTGLLAQIGAPNLDLGGAGARPQQSVARLEGQAQITNRVVVEPSPDFVLRVEQQIDARGALKTDSVGTMAP